MTTDPNGIQSLPFSNQAVNNNISMWLEPELLEFYKLAYSVHSSAQFVLDLPLRKSDLKLKASALQKVYTSDYQNWLQWFVTDNDSASAWMMQRIFIGKWTIFAFDIVLWVVTLVALILAFAGEKNKKTVLSLSIFGALCLLVISIAFLYYMWGIAALSGVCNIAKELVNGNSKILEDINASANLKDFVNKCIFSNDINLTTAE